MKDENKTKNQLIKECQELRQQIADRMQIEKALKESEERFRTIFNKAADGLVLTNVDDKKFHSCNKMFSHMLGYTEEEIRNLSVMDIHPKEDLPYIIEQFKKLANGETTVNNDIPVKRKDGSIFYADIDAVPISLSEKTYLIGIFRDITERKLAEEELHESETRLRLLSDNLPNGLVYQIDTGKDGRQRRFLYISAGVEQLHGITTTEALNNAMSIYGQIIAEDRLRLDEEEAVAIATMETFISEARVRLPSGEIRWRLFTSAPRRLPNNHLLWDGIEIDITDRKRIEEALKEREKELQIEARNLEEANIALKVLLKRRDEDKADLEDKVLLNIKGLVTPYLEKLKMSGLDKSQKAYVTILESSLNQITSPFLHRLSFSFANFTPTEIQVANLLKQGKTSKEIGELLNSSSRTIAFHRDNIRKRLGLKNKKTNLKSYLLSLK